MDTRLFKLIMFSTLFNAICCHAMESSDKQLLGIAQQAFEKWKAVKNEKSRIEVIRESMANLSDAEKTRALALRIFDLDAKDQGRMRYNAPSSIERVLKDDPTLITESSELEGMIANETNARKFFILASMASQLMDSQKSDFVVEMAPMLFRHDPLAKMDGEAYFESLSDASFFSYGMIVRNLKLLNANFIPSDDNLPYPERISILVKWLKANYPGCENLGEDITTSKNRLENKALELPAVREQKRISSPTGDQSSKESPSSKPSWQVFGAIVVLLLLFGIWLKGGFRSGST